MSSGKCQPFFLGLNVLKVHHPLDILNTVIDIVHKYLHTNKSAIRPLKTLHLNAYLHHMFAVTTNDKMQIIMRSSSWFDS